MGPLAAADRAAAALTARWHGHPWLDRLFYGASWLGDDGGDPHPAVVLRAGTADRPVRLAAHQLMWLTCESVLVNGPLKSSARRPRPAARQATRRLRRPSDSSFPSGHAASAGTMAVLLSARGMAPLWWTLAGTIAASRVHVGVHHLTDVVAGLGIGTAIGLLALRLDPALAPHGGRTA